MLSPRSPSDWGQLSSEKEDEASQKTAVKAWKAEKSRMPSRISKQKAKVVAYHEGGVVATILSLECECGSAEQVPCPLFLLPAGVRG